MGGKRTHSPEFFRFPTEPEPKNRAYVAPTATDCPSQRFESMDDDGGLEILGTRERNDSLELIARRLAARYGVNAEMYVDVRAATAERLGARRRSRIWRVVQGILRRQKL